MPLHKTIEIYGDSLMKGTFLDLQAQRYRFSSEKLISNFQENFSIKISNKSMFGSTIVKGYDRLCNHIAKGLDCEAVLLEYGGNDCDFNWDEVADNPDFPHLPHTVLPVFIETYRKMVASLQERNITPIIMSLPPLDANRYFKWIIRNGLSGDNILKWLGDVQRIYRQQEMYSFAAAKIAHDTSSMFIDVRSPFLAKQNCKDFYSEDGIHLNEKGYDLVYETFVDFATSMK